MRCGIVNDTTSGGAGQCRGCIALVVDDAAGGCVMALVVPVVRVIALMVVVHVVGCGRHHR